MDLEEGCLPEPAERFLREDEGKVRRSSQHKEGYGFGKSERIKRNFEYRRVYREGISYRDGIFILTICKNDAAHHRLGISIRASKVPLASKRNRIKRLIREVFRINKEKIKNGPYDVVITIAKTPPYRLNYSIVENSLKTLLGKAGVL
jgi:ribonuclease P protein component